MYERCDIEAANLSLPTLTENNFKTTETFVDGSSDADVPVVQSDSSFCISVGCTEIRSEPTHREMVSNYLVVDRLSRLESGWNGIY